MGKVLVSPLANATNNCKFCVVWIQVVIVQDGRDVGMLDIMVVMDEGTSSRAGDKEDSLQGLGPQKNNGTQRMDIENQNLLFIDTGQNHSIGLISMLLLIKIDIM